MLYPAGVCSGEVGRREPYLDVRYCSPWWVRPHLFRLQGRGSTLPAESFVASVGRDLPSCPSKSFLRGSEPRWSKRALAALRTAQTPPQMDRLQLQNYAPPPPGKALSLGGESAVTGPQARACGLP
ncbi:hypothetical protein NDU88_008250 [Pleurodeles waltl]|uniref:Uncharacterized protein n=1 Tax=Pleurodeles waltl TaxID=8319 RepID=A0AAV7VVV0_PLEWA|nr:hypothetical protein NDU88_008250 [Pleurodeles waltl]